jgi:hypothetical protein
MRQTGGVGLPVLPIERLNNYFFWLRFQTTHVDIKTVGVRTRNVKHLYSANFAEKMFGHARIECVRAELVLALQQFETSSWHDQMQKSGFATDRTIAFFARDRFCRLNLRNDGAAVTTGSVVHPRPLHLIGLLKRQIFITSATTTYVATHAQPSITIAHRPTLRIPLRTRCFAV